MTRRLVADYKISGVCELLLTAKRASQALINYDSKNMSANSTVSAVLTHVDRELDSSLDRLFAETAGRLSCLALSSARSHDPPATRD